MKISGKALGFLERPSLKVNESLLGELCQSSKREVVIEYFRKTSVISRMLMKDPGSFEALEITYTGRRFKGVVNNYFTSSLSNQALRNRLISTTSYLILQIEKIVAHNGNIKIVNLGSGLARDTIEALARSPKLANSVSVDCVDIDINALALAKKFAQEKKIEQSFKFSQKSITNLSYIKEIDLGLLIGILCGLEHRQCVVLLKKIRRYLKKGGILIASNVLKTMQDQDPIFASVLRNIIGWKLIFKTPEELQQIFEEAGYEWKGVFYDEPTRFHGMGIGVIPLT